jgi:tRNA(adenine34) deaminase
MDEMYMQEALKEARLALLEDEVPVGAVIVQGDVIIGRGHNRREIDNDPTAHAEIVAIRRAAESINAWRLSDATMYVTIEPCCMCAGALVLARIKRLVFGAYDPKAGAVGSITNVLDMPELNHRIEYKGGVLAGECRSLIQDFFKTKRMSRRDG